MAIYQVRLQGRNDEPLVVLELDDVVMSPEGADARVLSSEEPFALQYPARIRSRYVGEETDQIRDGLTVYVEVHKPRGTWAAIGYGNLSLVHP